MEPIVSKLVDFGLAGSLMACIIVYTWYIITRVLPKQQERHIADLKATHKKCEEELSRVSDEFRAVLQEQRKTHIALVERICNKLENVDASLVLILRRFDSDGPDCKPRKS